MQTGAKDVINRLKTQAAACPDAKFALVGYSQGASVIRTAAKSITPDLEKKIVAVVLYGDPSLRSGTTIGGNLGGKLLENCAVGDSVSL